MSVRPDPSVEGFSLIEVMVALVVFSLAAVALLRLQSASLTTAIGLDDRLMASIVASNQAIEAELETAPPGGASGSERAGGHDWRWTRRVTQDSGAGLMRIDIAVTSDEGQTLASQSVVRAP
ncbi:type II secretion system minor pseudopilin GspI [Sandarakinorhabdus sp.]|uniref:type II secretion system minor pseudopilin GspI n=1 Tax=Sandarakinorhabdus sp. TaxID=1916663 RepID=UPI00286E963A|nr:type II secretion system minor pseudopilin GspI [Sandarakinorhabdus sp.]